MNPNFLFHTCRRLFQVWSRACRLHFHTVSKSKRVQSRNCNQYLWWHRVRFRRMCKAARLPCNKGLPILQTSCPCSTSAYRCHRNVHQSQCLFLHRQCFEFAALHCTAGKIYLQLKKLKPICVRLYGCACMVGVVVGCGIGRGGCVARVCPQRAV